MTNKKKTIIKQNDLFRILEYLFLITISVLFAAYSVIDIDTWWHMKAGEWIVTHKQFLYHDIFTYTVTGSPWIYNGWLGGVLFDLVYQIGGVTLLHLINPICAVLTFFLVWNISVVKKHKTALSLLLFFVVAWILHYRFFIRPHVLAIPLLAFFLWIIDRAQNKGFKFLLWLLPLAIFWVNVHASALVMLVLYFLYVAGKIIDKELGLITVKQHIFILFLLGCSLLINPYGYHLILLPISHLNAATVVRSQEWTSLFKTEFLFGYPVLFGIGLLIADVIVSIKHFKRIKYCYFFMVLFLGIYAVLHIRFFGFFGLVSILYLHSFVQKEVKLESYRKALLAILCISVLLIFIGIPTRFPVGPRVYPKIDITEKTPFKAAAQFLKTHQIKGPLFNELSLSGHIIWELFPAQKVLFDTRKELIPPEDHQLLLKIPYQLEALIALYEKYGFNTIILPHHKENQLYYNLIQYLRKEEFWIPVYTDEDVVIFETKK